MTPPTAPPAPPAHQRLNRVARGGALNLAGAGASALSAFILAIVITRGGSKETAGVFFTATSLFLLATNLGQLGTNTGLVYFLSRARGRGTLRNAPIYMRTARRPVLVVAILVSVMLVAWAEPLGELMSKNSDPAALGYAVRMLALFIPAASLLNVSLSGTRGLGTMRPTAALDQFVRPLLQLVLVAAIAIWTSTQSAPLVWAIPYLPLAVVAWYWWRRLERKAVGNQRPDPEYRPERAFWTFTAPRALASVAQVAMQRLDVLLVAGMAGVAQAAIYAASTRFLSLGLTAAGAMSQAVQPHLGESLGREDRATAQLLYQTATGWLVLGAWPIYLSLLNFAPTILRVFGEGYGEGSQVLVILSASMLVATGCGMVSMMLTMAGKTSWNLANVLLSFGVTLGLDLWLIPRMGIIGAATGWAVGILTGNVVPLIQVRAAFKLHPFGRETLTAMAISAAAIGAVPFLIQHALGPSLATMVVALSVGAAVYVGALWLTRRQTRLADMMRAVFPGRRKGVAGQPSTTTAGPGEAAATTLKSPGQTTSTRSDTAARGRHRRPWWRPRG